MSMGNKPGKHRLRFPTNPTVWKVPVITSKTSAGGFSREIAVGDLIMLMWRVSGSGLTGTTAGSAYPFSAYATADIASVADYFLGVAMNASKTGESTEILVAVDGEFAFPCTHAAKSVGQYVVAANTGNSVDSASVGVSASTGNDLGRVTQADVAAVKEVTFEIKSKIAGEIG